MIITLTGKSSHHRLFLILWIPALILGKTWQWKSHVDLSVIQDDNVLESTDSTRQMANSARFMAHVGGMTRPSNKCGFNLNYQGGVEGFQSWSRENRMIHHLQGNGSYFLNSWLTASGELQLRNRRFLEVDRGYGYLEGNLELKIRLPMSSSLRLWTKRSSMSWIQGRDFNFTSAGDGVCLHTSVNPRFGFHVGYFTELLKYERLAYDFERPEPSSLRWIPLDENRKDLIHEFHAGFTCYAWALIRVNVSFHRRFSNSYGQDHDRPCVQLMLVKALPWRLSLRFYGKYHRKTYRDARDLLIVVNPDSENDESRHLLVDLIKDLTPAIAVRFRIGKYNNESPFRNLYYDKVIFSLGMTQRF